MEEIKTINLYRKLGFPVVILLLIPLGVYFIGKSHLAIGMLFGVLWSISSFVLLVFSSKTAVRKQSVFFVFLIGMLKLVGTIVLFSLLVFYWHVNLFGIFIGVSFFIPLVLYSSFRS